MILKEDNEQLQAKLTEATAALAAYVKSSKYREQESAETRLKKLKDQTNDETNTLNQTKLDLTVKNKDLTTQAQECFMWKLNVGVLNTLICAGNILYAGGENTVVAYNAIDGKLLWQANVDGKVYGLAIANKKLLVSTDTGSILCFEDQNGG